MEELRIERRHVADVVCLAFKRLAPVDGIYRRDGVAEGKIGSLDAGKYADFILVDRDISAVTPVELAATRVGS